MKTAIIGSRNLFIDNFADYLPVSTTEIVSGGAKGIDNCAKKYAVEHKLVYTEFLPDYKRFGKGAPLKRNIKIIEYSDYVIAFWDGASRGTKHVIENCKRMNKPIKVYYI